MAVEDRLWRASRRLAREVDALTFPPPVTHVYNPLRYAASGYREYLRRYGATPKRVVLLGMNPGPFGMAQTGVPFGEVAHVRDWLGISAKIGKPDIEHPKRPVLGLRLPAQRGERGAALGRIRRAPLDARALLRRTVRCELLPAAVPGGERQEPHARSSARGRARATLRRLRPSSPPPCATCSSPRGSSVSASSRRSAHTMRSTARASRSGGSCTRHRRTRRPTGAGRARLRLSSSGTGSRSSAGPFSRDARDPAGAARGCRASATARRHARLRA